MMRVSLLFTELFMGQQGCKVQCLWLVFPGWVRYNIIFDNVQFYYWADTQCEPHQAQCSQVTRGNPTLSLDFQKQSCLTLTRVDHIWNFCCMPLLSLNHSPFAHGIMHRFDPSFHCHVMNVSGVFVKMRWESSLPGCRKVMTWLVLLCF